MCDLSSALNGQGLPCDIGGGCFFNGKKNEGRDQPVEMAASPRRHQTGAAMSMASRQHPSMVLQGDFRKVSGISTEIFRQIETVENDHDASTVAAFETVEKRGEMVVRFLDPRQLGRVATESARKFLDKQDSNYTVNFVEIVKRPGQTLGLYIREGNGINRADGVFISRIALESAVYNSGCLKVGDEILAVNMVDVTRMGLDDVVIIMSIPRRLVLTTRQRKHQKGVVPSPYVQRYETKPPPVVVIKKEIEDEIQDESTSNGDNGGFSRKPSRQDRGMYIKDDLDYREYRDYKSFDGHGGPEDQFLYYNSRPDGRSRGPPKPRYPNTLQYPPEQVPTYQEPVDAWYSESSSVTSYQPPPPVITEQPKASVQHFQPYERSYPKTLESLAEKVHTFYSGTDHPYSHRDRHGRSHTLTSSRMLGSSSVDRSRRSGRVTRGQLTRSESDQRLPYLDTADGYDYGSRLSRSTASTLKYPLSATASLGRQYQEAIQRLNALRKRTSSLDYSSDTEVMASPRLSMLSSYRRGHPSSLRSNSLPRDTVRNRQRQLVHFERELSLPAEAQEDSDGALSAPELPAFTKTKRKVPSSSNFTSDEYQAWMQRAPSTSAIYERLRQTHDVIQTQRAARFTFSAENLLDRSQEDRPYYAYRSHLGTSSGTAQPLARAVRLDALSGQSNAARRARYLLDEGKQIPQPTPTRPTDPNIRLLEINPAEYLKYKIDKSTMPSGGEGMSGLVWVHLLAGRGLKSSSRTEHYRDLYCVLECDRVHKARTVVRTGDQNFDWDETFELDLMKNKELDFLIYSWDPQFRHKLCYKGSVHLITLFRECPIHQLALKIDPRGTLYLKIRYTDPWQTFKRNPSQKKTSSFGNNLESVVTREASGLNIPVLVKRCVEEIERRGLDIIGLYRLCGSATKKKILKEAFERNPRLVDLSAENVPDINVITGLLKDFLRELPEPLMTKCLYQMTVDALGVCLPDDPEGNAKLMFSILDCLPKVNRCTLLFLMEHFRLVVSQADRNKMTATNLAACFGAILMVQTEGTSPIDFDLPIKVLQYLLEIWPAKSDSSGSSSSEGSQNDTYFRSHHVHDAMRQHSYHKSQFFPESGAGAEKPPLSWISQ